MGARAELATPRHFEPCSQSGVMPPQSTVFRA